MLAGQPVHGPNPRLTYKSVGKTASESLPDSASPRKAEREVAELRKFQRPGHEFPDRPGKHTRKTGTHNRYFAVASELAGTLSRVFGERQANRESIRSYLRPLC